MAYLWLINGGDPNHLQVLGWSSKYSGPIWSREDCGFAGWRGSARRSVGESTLCAKLRGETEFNMAAWCSVLGPTFWIGVAVDWFVGFVLSWVVCVYLFRCMVAWFGLVGFLLALRRRSASTKQWLQWHLGLMLVTDAWGNPPGSFIWGGKLLPRWSQLRRKRVTWNPKQPFINGLFQLDDSKSLYRKWLFHQTSIYNWLFGVPGMYYCTKRGPFHIFRDTFSLFMIAPCGPVWPARPLHDWSYLDPEKVMNFLAVAVLVVFIFFY